MVCLEAGNEDTGCNPAYGWRWSSCSSLGYGPSFPRTLHSAKVSFTILVAVMMAVSLNIIMGYTGYVSFGHVVFYGLGGYVGMYLIDTLERNLLLAILAGGACLQRFWHSSWAGRSCGCAARTSRW